MPKSDRTGTGTRSVFGYQMRFDLDEGFPLVTTKKVHLKSHHPRAAVVPARRLQRPLAAGARRDDLGRMGATRTATSGPVYGVQWRSWPTPDGGHIDQIAEVVEAAPRGPRLAPHHRQRLERGRAPEDGAGALPRVLPVLRRRAASGLSCQLYQRSADIFLGVPFNIASYALLTHMLAQQCDLESATSSGPAATATSTATTSSRSRCSCARDPYPYPTLNIKRRPASIFDYAVRGLRGRRLPAPPGDQGAGRGVTVALIAAVARNGVIGRDGAHALAPAGGPGAFQELTTGHAGDHGPQDLGLAARALPPAAGPPQHRRHAQPRLARRGRGARRLARRGARAARATTTRVFVIGGAEIYAAALPLADELVLTEIDADFDGDTFFPDWDRGAFVEASRDERVSDDGVPFAFVTYRRHSAPRQLAALAAVDALFETRGLAYWLFGGWAVDFYAGSITRPHSDVDIAVWLDDLPRIAALLEEDGWRHAPEPDEDGGTGYERAGVRLELTFLVRGDGGRVVTPLRDLRSRVARRRVRRRGG